MHIYTSRIAFATCRMLYNVNDGQLDDLLFVDVFTLWHTVVIIIINLLEQEDHMATYIAI